MLSINADSKTSGGITKCAIIVNVARIVDGWLARVCISGHCWKFTRASLHLLLYFCILQHLSALFWFFSLQVCQFLKQTVQEVVRYEVQNPKFATWSTRGGKRSAFLKPIKLSTLASKTALYFDS